VTPQKLQQIKDEFVEVYAYTGEANVVGEFIGAYTQAMDARAKGVDLLGAQLHILSRASTNFYLYISPPYLFSL